MYKKLDFNINHAYKTEHQHIVAMETSTKCAPPLLYDDKRLDNLVIVSRWQCPSTVSKLSLLCYL